MSRTLSKSLPLSGVLASGPPSPKSPRSPKDTKVSWPQRKTVQRLQGNARAVVCAGRLHKASPVVDHAEIPDRVLGSLKNFVPEDFLTSFKDWIELPDGHDDEGSILSRDASIPMEDYMSQLHKQRCATPCATDAPRALAGQRRKHDCLGNKLTRRRQDCPRHEQMKELLPHLPPDPPRLSRSVRKARAELAAQHSERERLKVEEQRVEARRRLCLCRFRAIGFAVLRRLRDEDEDFLEAVRTNPVMPMTPCTSEEGLEDAAGPGPKLFEHRLKQARRRKASTPGRSAQREELATRGNFRAKFIDDLVTLEPRIETQPLLAFMDQGEAAAIVQKDRKASKSSRQKDSSPAARGAAPEEEPKDAQSDAKASPGPTAAAKIAARRVKLQRMLDVLDPGSQIGSVDADVIVPLMFWLGLTKSRTAAMETLRMGFGQLQIENGTLLVLGDHVEVQMRLVEGLRHLVRRDSTEHMCEYLAGNSFQRPRAWFNSMRADPMGWVDITQVQNLFARMEVTSDRQTLFRFLSYIMENPCPSIAADHREAAAIESKKFSFNGFLSLICRCTTSWVLHRVLVMLMAESSGALATDLDIANRWIELQRRIMISLLVNHRFWGRESRQVLSALQPPMISTAMVEELQELSQEQWNALFQRVRAQGLASVLPQYDGV